MTLKRLSRGLLLAVSLWLGLTVSVPVHGSGPLTVLMYHRFDAGTPISISMEKFRRQMRYLKREDYHFVTLEELSRHLESGTPFPDNSVMITVDDGFRSTYRKAYPFLKKMEIPWVFYVYTKSVRKQYSSAVTWEMIREMADSGVEIENHSYSHGKFSQVEDKSDAWIERELRQPHRLLEEKTGQNVESFAIPYGMYDQRLLDILTEEMNYSMVFGIDPGVVSARNRPRLLHRFGVNRNTSWSQFKNKLRRLPLCVREVRPGRGERLNRSPERVRVQLCDPDKLAPGRINVFVSQFGRLKTSWVDREKGVLEARLPGPITRHWNRVIVTAFDPEKGRYRFYSHGIVFDT